MVDKELATKLRKQGLTYKNIASIVGCSEAWCKKNLAGVDAEPSVADIQIDTKLLCISILEDALAKVRAV